MSAEILRKAAALMRERATAASPSPWREFGYPVETVTGEGGEGVVRDPDGFDLALMTSDQFDDAPHIASWHPAVALEIAAFLDFAAAYGDQPAPYSPTVQFAVSIARAYLGSADD